MSTGNIQDDESIHHENIFWIKSVILSRIQ